MKKTIKIIIAVLISVAPLVLAAESVKGTTMEPTTGFATESKQVSDVPEELKSIDPTILGFSCIGTMKTRSSSEIVSSMWSIGGETLDRDFAVYDNYKSYLGKLGAKGIRLQGGWAKCEKQPGIYSGNGLIK